MKIKKKMNGTVLEVAVTGRLDTLTSPELEADLQKSLDDADSLLLDFANVDYISSAGLRMLLNINRIMEDKGGMKIINANEIVREVFEVTGFADILTIE